jgi:Tfp pilus assembly pilus retraction ATPase PilT
MKNVNHKMVVLVPSLVTERSIIVCRHFLDIMEKKIVIRILDSIRGVRKLDELGFSELQMKHIRNALGAPYGMVLISGPTGSGKNNNTLFYVK